MKNKIFFLTTIVLIGTTFLSCKKETEKRGVSPVKEYFKSPIGDSNFITLSEGDKVYELHNLGSGKKFIKLVSGFPNEFIGEELLNEATFNYYHNKNFHNILDSDGWERWLARNTSEGHNLPLKKMGIFFLHTNGKGSFVATNEAFVAWSYGGPTIYWNNTLYRGVPSDWLPEEGAYRLEWFCSLPIMDND